MATIKTVGQQVELNQKYNQMFMENIEKLEKAVLSEEVSTAMYFLTDYCCKILTINRLEVFGFAYSENLGFRQKWRQCV